MQNPQKKPTQSQMQHMEQSISEFSSSAQSLRTEADRARSIFGFGRRQCHEIPARNPIGGLG